MTKNQPIGIFDSGIGGLTVAKAISDLLPNEQLIYFGDTAHFPFGDKSEEAVKSYAEGIATFLLQQNCKAIVVACNTASALAESYLSAFLPKDVLLIDVIQPVAAFLNSSTFRRVGVIATKGTIGANVYPQKINALNPDIDVLSLATPLLAPMIEEAFFNNSISQSVINQYLSQDVLKNIDALVLGCTHYPLIETEVQQYYQQSGQVVAIVNSAKVVALAVQNQLLQLSLLSTNKTVNHHFYVSDYTDSFEKSTKVFFGNQLKLEKQNIWEG
ncbi:MAG: glutamate racemase [Flavobacteriales bacterium]|nr:glutamate racemase [Flavobacteriales bacterium]